MQLTSVKEILKGFLETFQLPNLIPSILTVLVIYLFTLPRVFSFIEWDSANHVLDFSILYSIAIVSFLFHANNPWLIRFFEGYLFTEYKFVNWIYGIFKNQYKKEFEKLKEQDTNDFHGNVNARKILENSFPFESKRILPTKVGNIIAAFESYPSSRYKIDSVQMWPRLIPVLQENKFIDTVITQKNTFDLMMNLLVAIFISGLQILYISAFRGDGLIVGLSMIGLVILLMIAYNGMVVASYNWGASIKIAFDLYRHDLIHKLNLRNPKNLKDERDLWHVYSTFIQESGDYAFLFDYEKVEKRGESK